MAEKALTAVAQEADVQGVSTRSVDDLVQAMGMTGISKSQVSRLCGEIDDKVKAFLARPIDRRISGSSKPRRASMPRRKRLHNTLSANIIPILELKLTEELSSSSGN
ncbi:hypothetical protein ACVWYH_001826 [Bradyrhizobium sp. GM24.11]